ncbi:MAG TPA: hypothetical protein VEJ63_04420 [Planctomycetota bacterium]|nr:hypothetical protein [Planctomycetota bacterium]
MKVWLVPGSPRDESHYLGAILRAWGVYLVERADPSAALRAADSTEDILVVSPGSPTEGIEEFLSAGGKVIAVCPNDDLAAKAGLRRLEARDAHTRVRLSATLCKPARGKTLWNPAPSVAYKGEFGAHVWAWQYVDGDMASECPAIYSSNVGRGRLVVFGYDPALTIARLRQGMPRRANYIPPGDRFPRSVHLHEPNPPTDAYWQPTADLHALTFCNVVKRLLSERAPVPTVWHLPENRNSVLIFSGDEDGAPQSANQKELQDVTAAGGTMNLYVIPEMTSITRELIQSYERAGHTVSVHPNLYPTQGRSQTEQLARAECEVRLMREKFGVAVKTVRNHSTIWPGYVELPELWERLGISMDANCFASRYGQSCEWGPYVNVDSAMPLPFVREDGTLIRVYQQPTHISDDMTCLLNKGVGQKLTPEAVVYLAQCMLDDAAQQYHAPICVCIHPEPYVEYSRELGHGLLSHARRLALPIWSVDRWHDFWRARESQRMEEFSWENSRLRFTLRGSECPGLTLNLPPEHGGKRLRSVTVNGRDGSSENAPRFGETMQSAICSSDKSEVVATYE